MRHRINSGIKLFLRVLFELLKKVLLIFVTKQVLLKARDQFELTVAGRGLGRRKNLLVVKFDSIGDFILVSTFLESLRTSERFGGYRFYFLGNQNVRELAEYWHKDNFDEFFWADKGELRRNSLVRLRLLFWFFVRRFDVVVHPTYSREFEVGDKIVNLTGAMKRIGFSGDFSNISEEQKSVGDGYYTELVETPNKYMFEFDRNAYFFHHLTGVATHNYNSASGHASIVPEKDLLAIFLGGQDSKRRWPLENLRDFIGLVLEKTAFRIVLLGGRDTIDASTWVENVFNSNRIFNKCAKGSLDKLVVEINRATILITHDTAALHMAAFLNKRAICISNGNHYGRFLPYPKRIYSRCIYLYPEVFEDYLKRDGSLVRNYYFGSGLDISTVSSERVFVSFVELTCLPE